MKNVLIINGIESAANDWGVRMGDSFLDTLTEPLTMKDYITNESRLEHGKRVVVDDEPKFASRELSLEFTITGTSQTDFRTKKNAFLAEMYKGNVTIQVPDDSDDVYNLVYLGKGAEYGMNAQRTFCHLILKFMEPDPSNRT